MLGGTCLAVDSKVSFKGKRNPDKNCLHLLKALLGKFPFEWAYSAAASLPGLLRLELITYILDHIYWWFSTYLLKPKVTPPSSFLNKRYFLLLFKVSDVIGLYHIAQK